MIQSLLIHQFWMVAMRAGMFAQNALISVLFAKIAVLTPAALLKHAGGSIDTKVTVCALFVPILGSSLSVFSALLHIDPR